MAASKQSTARVPELIVPSWAAGFPREWLWRRLYDVCDDIVDCPHSTPEVVDAGPYLMARTPDILSGVFRADEARRVSKDTYNDRTARAKPRFGDLLYSREGTYFGLSAEVPPNTLVCLGQRMVLLRPDAQQINSTFLRLWLNSPIVQRHLHGHRDGSVAERLNLPTIRALPICVPPLPEQRAIARILGTLDDKIELNRRMNETLEAMARALFKSWFVDFDPVRAKAEGRTPSGMDAETAKLFPSELVESELGEIPKGWRATTWGELVELAYGKALRDYKSGSGSVEVFGTNGPIGWTIKPLAEEPTVIIGRKGAYRGVHFAAGPSWTIDTAFFLKPKRAIQVRWAYYAIRQHDINEMDSGSAIPSTSRDAFYALGATEAPPNVQDAFQGVLTPVWDKQTHNTAESQRLESIRDALLPRLLSGELSVPDADRVVEDVA